MSSLISILLYERLLGRPFAGHRDSTSELVGNLVENAIEDVLSRAGISFRKTKRADRLPGFDQAPDFVIPNEFNPQFVIEAKLTEDDGTARDKVTRVQHLGTLRTPPHGYRRLVSDQARCSDANQLTGPASAPEPLHEMLGEDEHRRLGAFQR